MCACDLWLGFGLSAGIGVGVGADSIEPFVVLVGGDEYRFNSETEREKETSLSRARAPRICLIISGPPETEWALCASQVSSYLFGCARDRSSDWRRAFLEPEAALDCRRRRRRRRRQPRAAGTGHR